MGMVCRLVAHCERQPTVPLNRANVVGNTAERREQFYEPIIANHSIKRKTQPPAPLLIGVDWRQLTEFVASVIKA